MHSSRRQILPACRMFHGAGTTVTRSTLRGWAYNGRYTLSMVYFAGCRLALQKVSDGNLLQGTALHLDHPASTLRKSIAEQTRRIDCSAILVAA